MKKYISLLIVFLFGFFSIVDLIHPGFAVTHDGQDHIARIANFYLNLQQGVLVPRWAGNLNWGYGHPILEFLYPLPSYIASLFHFVGFSFVDSTKLVFALAMIASGLAMYLFAKSLWGEKAGVVSGILYMYAPYRFVDLYVRGDIGEHVAFVFVPLVFWGMYLLFKKITAGRLVSTSLFLAFLILSHNAIALMIVPLIFLYAIYLSWQKKWNKKFAALLLASLLLGFCLSAFFWLPALLEGQYTLRNIVTKGEYLTRFVSLPQLMYGPWSYGQTGIFTVQLGIVHWVFLILVPTFYFLFWKKSKEQTVFVVTVVAVTCAAIFLMLPISNFLWTKILLLQNFQFPWRFLAIPVFTTSLLGGFFIGHNQLRYKSLLMLLSLVALFLCSFTYVHARAYKIEPESFFTDIYNSTTDTGESSPIWSIRFMLHRFDKPLDIISGDAQISQEKRFVTKHLYTVSANGQVRLLENTLYFPGWRVTVDGNPVMVQFQDPLYRGLMTFAVPEGTHEVGVTYNESKIRLIGDSISIIAIGAIIVCFFILGRRKNES